MNAADEIALTGVDVDKVTAPRGDGTRGSNLYVVPFTLSRRPDENWARLFVWNWQHPPTSTTRHRPSIARVSGDRVVLDGTTMEEVEQVHFETLKLVFQMTNQQYGQFLVQETARSAAAKEAERSRTQAVAEIARRLSFDDRGDEAGGWRPC